MRKDTIVSSNLHIKKNKGVRGRSNRWRISIEIHRQGPSLEPVLWTTHYSPSSDKNCSIRRGWQSWNWAECSVMPGHETRKSKLYWFWQHHYLSNWLPLNGDWIFFNIWCASSSTWPKTEKTEDVPGTSQITLRGDLQGKHFFSTILHAEPPVLDTTPCASTCSASHNNV